MALRLGLIGARILGFDVCFQKIEHVVGELRQLVGDRLELLARGRARNLLGDEDLLGHLECGDVLAAVGHQLLRSGLPAQYHGRRHFFALAALLPLSIGVDLRAGDKPAGKAGRKLDRYGGWLASGALVVRFEDLIGGAGGGDDAAQASAIRSVYTHLGLDGRVVLVEYERRAASRWVPYPIPLARLAALTASAGLTSPSITATRPSAFGGILYVAAADRLADDATKQTSLPAAARIL